MSAQVILQAIVTSLEQQAEAPGPWEPYVDIDDPADVTLDGHFNLTELAAAVAAVLEERA